MYPIVEKPHHPIFTIISTVFSLETNREKCLLSFLYNSYTNHALCDNGLFPSRPIFHNASGNIRTHR